MRRLKIALLVTSAAVFGTFLHYTLPQTDLVRITSIENKVMQSETGRSDLYLIFAETLDGQSPRVYRNEDTGFGFPPYLKFGSANIQQKAGSLSQKNAVVAVTHYGWRLTLFSLFPNAVSVREVPEDHVHVPVFNIAFLTVLAGLVLLVRFRMKRVLSRIFGSRKAETVPAVAPTSQAPMSGSSSADEWLKANGK